MDDTNTLDQFGRPFPPPKLVPRTAADCMVFKNSPSGIQVLLITRKKPGPSQGKHAFPGGHIDYNEAPQTAAVREAEEETGIKLDSPELWTVRGDPERDDRYHMISIFYLFWLKDEQDCKVTAQDDAASAEWYDLNDILKKPEVFAFDHHEVLAELVEKHASFKELRDSVNAEIDQIQKQKQDYANFLINAEKWGQHKRWSDINFCRRLRNMRSQRVFKMPLKIYEKQMEKEWRISNGEVEIADAIQKWDLDPFEEQKEAILAKTKAPSLSIDVKTIKTLANEIKFTLINDQNQAIYDFQLKLSSIGVHKVQINLLSNPNPFKITALKDGPFLLENLFNEEVDYSLIQSTGENVFAVVLDKNAFGEEHTFNFEISPFQMHQSINEKPGQLSINACNLLSIEPESSSSIQYVLDGEEELCNEKKFIDLEEAIKNGPEAVSLDFSIQSEKTTVYGLGERCEGRTSLEDTTRWEPYRLWTADHYDEKMPRSTMYGVAPMIQVKKDGEASIDSILWANASDTFVDVFENPQSKGSRVLHWMSETGVIEYFYLSSITPEIVQSKLLALTGKPQLPPLWALGHHQCRWNYMTQDELLEVSSKMTQHSIPCDTLWLDIEYSDSKRYFTWDSKAFPTPRAMLDTLISHHRKLVTIIDPHVKHDEEYFVYAQTKQRGILVQNSNLDVYHGRCWPEQSAWVDYMNPASQSFLNVMYNAEGLEELKAMQSKEQLFGTTLENYLWHDKEVGIWIDMNEPACFEKTDKTMPKSNIHTVQTINQGLQQVEHRSLHSLYGFYSNQRTFEALKSRPSGERPFILSRSFYPGTQRFCAIWSGDSSSDWKNYEKCVPILLQKSMAGISFVGGDVPGFYGNPMVKLEDGTEKWDEELIKSWYRLGIFMPFFRAHAHINTLRREPWCFSPETTAILRNTIILRYKLLAYLYTQFHMYRNVNNLPIISPLWMRYPHLKGVQANEISFCFGPGIVVSVNPKVNTLPQELELSDFAFDADGNIANTKESDFKPMTHLSQQIIKGSIIPLIHFADTKTLHSTKQITDNLSSLTLNLHIFPDKQNNASGHLYLDDMRTFKENNLFIEMNYNNGIFKVDVKSNSFEQVKYDQSKALEEQGFVKEIVVHK